MCGPGRRVIGGPGRVLIEARASVARSRSGSYDFQNHSSAFQPKPTLAGLFFMPPTADFHTRGFGREYIGIVGTSLAMSESAFAKSAWRFAGSSSLFDASISFVAARLQYCR